MRKFLTLFVFAMTFVMQAQNVSDTAWMPEYRLMRPDVFRPYGATTLAAEWKKFGFDWNDQQKKLLTWKGKQTDYKVFGYKPLEAYLICGDKSAVASAEFSLWNDADGLPMEFEAYKNFVNEAAKKVGAVTGAKINQVKPSPRAQTIYEFECGDRNWRLICGFRDDRRKTPQFLKLLLREKQDEKSGKANYLRMNDLVANVVHAPDSSIYIDNIPMVDQGEKGYCVVATFARLLQYYGRDIDQHEVAQAAGSSADKGTSYQKFEEALDKLNTRYNLTMDNRLYEFSFSNFRKLCGDYNKEMKKMKADELPPGTENTYSLQAFNPVTLRTLLATKPNIKKFKRAIQTNIDKGVPLLWSVELGIYPENGEETPQTAGGHMRLIIGYEFSDKADLKTDKIIFSDSWGRGHDKKSMRLDDALCITRKIILVRPRGR